MTGRPAGLRIEPGTARDLPVILGFIKALAEYEQLAGEVVATEDSLRRTLFGDRPSAEIVIAFVDEVPAGFALYFQNYSTFLGRPGIYLEDLFVLPDWRRRGVGRALLSHVAGTAVSRGCGRLEWAVLDWNTEAIRFYRSVGARPMDEWTVFRLTGDALTAFAAGRIAR